MEKQIDDMTTEEVLSLLMTFTEKACNAMENHRGYEAGVNIRYVYETLKIRKIQSVALDDVDMYNGIVYIKDTGD